ncbi:MAG: hypothetical protein ACD_16C00121G0011 [uncultured bacterium]|nr:MAG: hypothetical protein ACD_16C00121G0011 [uncultured bacterium]OGT69188.1 MAG: hypothetical protein A3I12_06440 [Gammaproteobacteria bacterium RIFCSPLOWO2_02_FULL_38_11]HBG34588.1 hypothetical protein [Holosporales bacterium]HLD79862.1 hypothetical protein [Candidatus Nanoarchaeia archaeon]HLE24074.1 hypothetical protein [Thermodesulfobacteriota bacterium]
MKNFVLPSIGILAFSISAVYAGGGFSRLAIENSYPMVRHRISVKPNWFMIYSSRKYGTLRPTIGSKPTKPMPEKPFYEEMPKKVRFLDEQHERYVPGTGSVKETSKDSLPNVEKKDPNTTIITPQKKR